MATAEWDIPFEIVTPYGDAISANLWLNVDLGSIMGASWAGRQYRLNSENCTSKRSVRAATDNVPQGDGEIFHERYSTGYEMKLAIQLWEKFPGAGAEGTIACDSVLCEMRDVLFGHLWSLLRPSSDGGRVIWDPSCDDRRMMDATRLLSIDDPILGELGVFEVSTILDSPFPYAIALSQSVVAMSDGVPLTLPNDGNVEFYPVFKVYGPSGAWSIQDNDTGLLYLYNALRPGAATIGGGDYAEIDMFRGGLIYLNGDGANLKPGVDVEASDILTVAAGGSSYTLNGATADALMNDAFA